MYNHARMRSGQLLKNTFFEASKLDLNIFFLHFASHISISWCHKGGILNSVELERINLSPYVNLDFCGIFPAYYIVCRVSCSGIKLTYLFIWSGIDVWKHFPPSDWASLLSLMRIKYSNHACTVCHKSKQRSRWTQINAKYKYK